ncbi:MAG: 3-oxoacyl-[acyl-carrier protein] reductase [Acidobacteriaceae bacterium]|nr:3-oxoacyl-[acyl-carrier protein] reductase [Acidobacteriaceae bacterium]
MSSLSGKIAIVTGGSRGIGAAIATRLAGDGAAVAVNYATHEAEANDVVQKIVQAGGKAVAIRADVSKTEDVRLLFNEVAERFDELDILINNAGATHNRPVPIAHATDEIYDWTFAVNTKGTFLCLREAANHMRSGGRIVNLSSTGVFNAHPGYAIYSAAKSAVEVFTRGLCKELKGQNITVNCVAPGATATEQWLKGKSVELLQTIAKLSPLNRLGTPEDIAELVAFLVSPQGEWVNGQVIRANGGFA